MGALCKCGTGLGNTGRPGGCDNPMTVPKGIFMVQTFDSSGVKNFIDVSVAVNDAFITAKINNVDPSKRWYPLQNILGYASERADPVYESLPNGENAFIKDGVKPVTFDLLKGGAVLKSKLDKARCVDTSFYLINEGKLYGMDLTDGSKLHPIRISKASFNNKLIAPSDATVEKLQVTFQFDQREDDGNLRYIETATDADLLSYEGLVEVKSTLSNITTTGFKAVLFNEYGPLNAKLADSGLLLANFTLYNTTTSTTVTPTSVTENPNGTYTFVIPSQTSGNKLRLTPLSPGKDYANVVSNLITIP